MKRLPQILLLSGAFTATIAVIAAPSAVVTSVRFRTEDEVKVMSPCSATLEQKTPCSARLKTTEGKIIHLGSPDAPAPIVHFIQTLEKGGTYQLPEAFLAYQKIQGASGGEPPRKQPK